MHCDVLRCCIAFGNAVISSSFSIVFQLWSVYIGVRYPIFFIWADHSIWILFNQIFYSTIFSYRPIFRFDSQFYSLSKFFGLSRFLNIDSVFRFDKNFRSVLIWRFDKGFPFDQFFFILIFLPAYLPSWFFFHNLIHFLEPIFSFE